MRANIRITSLWPASGFELSFTYGDRAKAQAATRSLVAVITNAHVANGISRAGVPAFTLQLMKPADLPDRSVNPYILKGSAGLATGLLLGFLVVRFTRERAVA